MSERAGVVVAQKFVKQKHRPQQLWVGALTPM